MYLSMSAVTEKSEALVRHALRRRGHCCGPGRHEGALIPRSKSSRSAWYELLKRYSFRLFLRDLIRLREGAATQDLTHYCSPDVAVRFAENLQEIGIARRRRDGRICLCDRTVRSFGPTLEWFVATVLEREFGIPAAWNLRPLRTEGGGDYDVVGSTEGSLVYVEVKSSAPRNIDQAQVRAFVHRISILAPDMAIFLNDTQLRMLDKLVPAVRRELRIFPFADGPIRRVQGEIFSRDDRLFVTNSEPDLIGNLGICLARFFHRRGKLW